MGPEDKGMTGVTHSRYFLVNVTFGAEQTADPYSEMIDATWVAAAPTRNWVDPLLD
jgi:hypothetical protein